MEEIETIALKFYDHSTYIRGYSKATVRRYKTAIQSYCRISGIHFIHETIVSSLRDFFLHGRTKSNWKVNTYICFHNTLTVFFRWCVNEGYMVRNPILDIEVPKLEKALPTKLTKQQTLRLLEVVYNYPYENMFLRYRNHAIFSTFVYAGLRKQELLSLRYADVDIPNLTLFVRRGKGNKDRVVPISTTLAEALKKILRSEKNRIKPALSFSSQ